MLHNYDTNNDGLLFQIKKTPIVYDIDYVKSRYDTYGELNNYISNLRLGYMMGLVNEPIKSIFDVGYGNGAFLKTCQKVIPRCSGYDVTKYPLPPEIEFVEEWTSAESDVFTFFDVLEHLETPYIIKDLKCKYVIVSVPWCHYESDEWFRDWKHRRPNEHLWFFNEKNIGNFAKTTGYELMGFSNIEDTVRGSTFKQNILTFGLKKI